MSPTITFAVEDGDIIARLRGVPNYYLAAHGSTVAQALQRLTEAIRLAEAGGTPRMELIIRNL